VTSNDELSGVRAATRDLFDWLCASALPLWSTMGVDWDLGGFVERLSPEGEPIADVRRARLVARQVYAFKAAGELGWSGPVPALVEHGVNALCGHHISPDHEVISCYVPAEDRHTGGFDLYDQAFGLFGLAHAFAHLGDPNLETHARSILSRLRERWAHPTGGFVEHQPAQPPLKANPHMHLLEAALAWSTVSSDPAWPALAKEMVDLCIARFIDPGTGGLREFFNEDWNAIQDSSSDIVEPGHQSEWAWLLMRWSERSPTDRLKSAAKGLLAIAENEGLNTSQHRLVNELHADLSIRDGRLRLWPQTERIKSLIRFSQHEAGGDEQTDVMRRIEQSVRALLGYFDHAIAGSWWEHFDENGKPLIEPARASSLYHIMGAATELGTLTGMRLT